MSLVIKPSFWDKVDKQSRPQGCWPWLGSQFDKGYGQVSPHYRVGIKSSRAHKVAWILTHGPIPEGLHVLHRCDNRLCVNPTHLFLGTHQDNMDDKVSKGRQAHNRGERAGGVKLSSYQVLEIRSDPRTQKVIAQDYGIGQMSVCRIKRKETWGHI